MSQEAKKQRKIRNYLLNPRYQLRYTGIMLVIAGLLLGGLGTAWYHELRQKSTIIGMQMHPGFSDDRTMELDRRMLDDDRLRLARLAGTGLVFLFALGAFSMTFTHKVAGPIQYISQSLRELGDGRFRRLRSLRDGDRLKDFFDLYRSTHEKLREQVAQETELIGRHISALEQLLEKLDDRDPKVSALRESLAGLRELRERKQAGLGIQEAVVAVQPETPVKQG